MHRAGARHDAQMRILLVSHGLPPESVGGVEQHVEGLARALCARGHEVAIYTRTGRAGPAQGTLVDDPPGHLPCRVSRVVYRHEGLQGLATLYRDDVLDAAFARYLGDTRFDVVHVHHLTGISCGILDRLRTTGIRVVLTLHDYWLICARGQMWHRTGTVCAQVEPERCAACLEPTFGGLPAGVAPAHLAQLHAQALGWLRGVDQIVVPSAAVLPPFAALGLATDRFRVVGNGVDTLALEQVPAPPEVRAGPLRVGYLGTLIPSKGLDVLVDAIALLPPGTASLDIFGNAVPYHGDAGFLTRVFSRLTPESAVRYHGPYRTEALPRILGDLDVVVAPALWQEAFGLTVREAMAAGRPVVVSRIGGLAEAVATGAEGCVVAPGDREGLAAALATLAGDRRQLVAMGRAARRQSRGFLTMAAELEAIYREVAAGTARA